MHGVREGRVRVRWIGSNGTLQTLLRSDSDVDPSYTSCTSPPAHFGPGERESCHAKGKAGHTGHKAGSRLRDEVVFLQFVRPRWFLHWSTILRYYYQGIVLRAGRTAHPHSGHLGQPSDVAYNALVERQALQQGISSSKSRLLGGGKRPRPRR